MSCTNARQAGFGLKRALLGKKPTESRTLVTPFYLSWDPTSSRIAYLSAGDDGVQLGILELTGQSSGTPLETGQPSRAIAALPAVATVW